MRVCLHCRVSPGSYLCIAPTPLPSSEKPTDPILVVLSTRASCPGVQAIAWMLFSVGLVTCLFCSDDACWTTLVLMVLQCLPTIPPVCPEGQASSPTVHWDSEWLSLLHHKEPWDMTPEVLASAGHSNLGRTLQCDCSSLIWVLRHECDDLD